jgi:hypothetical protein
MNRFTEKMALRTPDGTIINWRNRYKNAKLTTLDDLGLHPLTSSQIIITSNSRGTT